MKCIILAGGAGERLWPISRELYAKSLINFFGSDSLIQNVYKIASSVTSEKNILTITNIRQETETLQQLKKINSNPTIISEPMSKNTAPAVASALTYLQAAKDDIVLILPVDFSIDNIKGFISTIEKAKKLVKKDYIVCFGIKPAYAEDGFGYIKTGEDLLTGKKVERFIEKPDKLEIEKYIKKKEFYWNSGIYMGKLSVFIDAYKKCVSESFWDFSKEMFDENNKIKYAYYENIPNVSIDYALIEKVDNLAFVEMESSLFDYGNWHTLYNNSEKDAKGNVIAGNVITDKVKNCFIHSSKELVAVSGMKNTIVIETEDALLVCDKSKASDINKLVKELKRNNDETTLARKTMFRPWGYYTCMNGGDGWLTKIISVSPGHKLSLQSHNHRSEHWVVLEGTATVILDDNVHTLNKRQSIDIPVKAKHSLQNHTNELLKILEVQKGDYISEDDIIRYEDMYGRVK